MVIKFRVPRAIKCSSVEAANIDSQISLFLEKGIIIESSQEHEQFISTIFLREKKNGSFRMILNLKELNTWINYNHFKMDSIHTCIQLMKPHCFMGSDDLCIRLIKNILNLLGKENYTSSPVWLKGLLVHPDCLLKS